jgi:hypothetical protein
MAQLTAEVDKEPDIALEDQVMNDTASLHALISKVKEKKKGL